MSADPKQVQLLAQAERLEKLEDRICGAEQVLQTLIVRPPGEEAWYVRHCGCIVACVVVFAIAFIAGTVLV